MENTQRDIVTEYEEHVMHLKEEVTVYHFSYYGYFSLPVRN